MSPLLRPLLLSLLLPMISARAALTAGEISAALDSGDSIAWQDAPDAWTVTPPAQSHDGVDGLRTPGLEPNGGAELTGTVQGPGTLRGWVRASSERDRDVLRVQLDGLTYETFSGERSGAFALPVPRGVHSVSLVWQMDASRREGADAAWLDGVVMERTAVSPREEALDITGTPDAARVTFSTPVGAEAWEAIADRSARAGGDAMFAPSQGPERKLVATANAASLVTFWTQVPGGDPVQSGYVTVQPQGGAQFISRTTSGLWTRWQYVLPAGAGVLVETVPRPPGGALAAEVGFLIDDWRIEPLAPVSLAEALDAPGLTFTMQWGAGGAANDPWLPYTAAAATGLTSDGSDAVLAVPPSTQPASGHSQSLQTTLTGPGRLSLRWKMVEGTTGSGGAYIVMLNQATGAAASHLFRPSTAEWQTQTVDVPPGTLNVSVEWAAYDYALLLDRFEFTPTPRAVPPPSVNEAADVNGLTFSAGNWQPGGWNGAGMGNDDVLRWQPGGEHTPLTAGFTGPGWLSFAWRVREHRSIGITLDGGAETSLLPLQPQEMPDTTGVWQHSAWWLPAGAHTLALSGGTGWSSDGEEIFVDGLTFSTAPPAWVAGLEGTGITSWQMAAPPWPVVTDETHDGTDALRLPALGAQRALALTAGVQGPGTLRFWWRQGDPLPDAVKNNARFNIQSILWNGVQTLQGHTDWQEVVLDLPDSLPYRLQWDHLRSARPTLPGDGLWLDEVVFTPTSPVPLGVALDATEFVWASQGAFRPFTGGFSEATGGAVVELPADFSVPAPAAAWLQTTVDGPGIVKLIYFGGLPSYPGEIWLDGVQQSLPTGSSTLTAQVFGSGPHTCRFVFPHRHQSLLLDSFSFTPMPLTPAATALDLPGGIIPVVTDYNELSAGLLDAVNAHDGTDVLHLKTLSVTPTLTIQYNFSGPAQVRFWWRGGPADGGTAWTGVTPSNSNLQRQGSFAWEQQEFLATHRGAGSLWFQVSAFQSPPGAEAWVDEVVIQPFAEVPLATALSAGTHAFTTGGSAAWLGWQPPLPPLDSAAGNGSLAGVYLPGDSMEPAWIETQVSGPGELHYRDGPPGWNTSLTITRQPSGGGAAVEHTSGSPVLIPPGVHTVRWSTRRTYVPTQNTDEMSAVLRDVRLVPALDIAASLNAPGLTWTTTPAPDGFWYGDSREPGDLARFADDTLVRVSGQAVLETTLTGPGWLRFEAAFPQLPQGTWSWPEDTTLRARLQVPNAPDPAAPWLWEIRGNVYYPNDDLRRQLWIPAGAWRVQFEAKNAGTLNNVRFTPALDNAALAAALEAGPGLTVSAESTSGGPVLSPVSHDGTDAVQLVSAIAGQPHLLDISFTGPAVLTGWLRMAERLPYSATPPSPEAGMISGGYMYDARFELDGQPLSVALPAPAAGANGWFPLRLPVPVRGPVTISLSLLNPIGEHSPYVLQVDELALSPLPPVPLAEALDAPGLTWTAAPDSWTGGASAIASPDGTDAAWIISPQGMPGAPDDPPVWLETTVTGPGSMRVRHQSPYGMAFLVGGQPAHGSSVYLHQSADGLWTDALLTIPSGPQTVRLQPDRQFRQLAGVDFVHWEPSTPTTVHAALDLAPDVNFTATGGTWLALNSAAHSHDGTDALHLRSPLAEGSAIETTITGPALVAWWELNDYTVEVTRTLDGALLREAPSGSGGGIIIGGLRNIGPPAVPVPVVSFWQREEVYVPPGVHTLRWSAAPRVVLNWWWPPFEYVLTPSPTETLLGLDEFSVTPQPAGPSLAEAVDQPSWTVSTNRPDKVKAITRPDMTHDGTDAVMLLGDSSYSPDDMQPVLRVTVPAPGVLRYRWRSMGTTAGNWPRIQVNGSSNVQRSVYVSEDSPWTDAWILLPNAGANEITWTYPRENHGLLLDAMTLSPGISLGMATGAPALTWTTGGTAPWTGLPELHDGNTVYPARAAGFVAAGQSSWIEAAVTGPGRLQYSLQGPVVMAYDGLDFHTTANTSPFPATLVIPAGLHRVRWSYAPIHAISGPEISLSNVTWSPSAAPDPLAEALDAPHLPWLLGSDAADWTPQTTHTADGVDALNFALSPLAFGGQASISTIVPWPGTARVKARADGRYLQTVSNAPAEGDWRVLTQPLMEDRPQVFTILAQFSGASVPEGRLDFDEFSYTPASVSLAEGMDAHSQTWTTSPDKPFAGYLSTDPSWSVEGGDAVMAVNAAEGAWLETIVTGPALVQFSTKGLGGYFTYDGVPVHDGHSTGWEPVRLECGTGLHTLRWVKRGESSWSVDHFQVTPVSATLADALDFNGPWFLSPPAEWSLINTDTADGTDAASFSHAFSSETILELPVVGPGRLEFDARLPRSDNDPTLPQPLLQSLPGFTSWTDVRTGSWRHTVAGDIPPGPQRLRFVFRSQQGDPAPPAMDRVNFTPYAPATLADALDGASLTTATNPAAPWTGWQNEASASDGTDAAVSQSAENSWLDITVPPGAGELTFMLRAAGSYAQHLYINDGFPLDVAASWKRYTLPVSATDSRTFRFLPRYAASLQLDDMRWNPASTALSAWLAAHGLPPDADLNSDADADGQPLVFEYAFGLDPTAPHARDPLASAEAGLPQFEFVQRPGGGPPALRSTFLRRTGGKGLTYDIQFNDTPASLNPFNSGSTQTGVEEVTNDWERVTVYDSYYHSSGPPERRFMRARVSYDP